MCIARAVTDLDYSLKCNASHSCLLPDLFTAFHPSERSAAPVYNCQNEMPSLWNH